MVQGTELIKRFEAYCPLEMAEEGDNCGLAIGTLKRDIHKLMITLDVRPETVEEAINQQVDLIIAKHPPLFRPAKALLDDQPQTKMYNDLIRHNIAVYAAHTNIDIIENGLNDWFCELLGIEDTTYLHLTHRIPVKKIIVFTPPETSEKVRQALTAVGAGKLGHYTGCSYSVSGIGRFTPMEDAHPVIGTIHTPEVTGEERIEMIFPAQLEEKVIQQLMSIHPYEEPAFDILTLDNQQQHFGLGRIGNLQAPQTLSDFTQKVKEVFQLDGLRVICRDSEQLIQRVAICGGSGEKFYRDALRQQADVYITGDIYYHTAHDMLAEGLNAIDPGHYIEVLFTQKLTELFQQWQQAEGWSLDVTASKVNTNPFQFY